MTTTTDRPSKLAPVIFPRAIRSQKQRSQPGIQSKPLDQQKLSQFTSNTVRKSKREKDAEAAEVKRREEEEHAAKVLSFVQISYTFVLIVITGLCGFLGCI